MEKLNDEMKWYFATENEAIQYKRKFILDHSNIHRLLSWLNNMVLEKKRISPTSRFHRNQRLIRMVLFVARGNSKNQDHHL